MASRMSGRSGRWLGRSARWALRGAGLCMALVVATAAYFWLSTALPTPEQLRAQAAAGSTRILDRNGQLLYQLPDPLSGEQRPVALAEIPLALRQATIAVEDRSFYQNSGVDLRGIARAVVDNLASGEIVAGGSTLTQQLARNFLLDPGQAQEQSLIRKLREMVLAVKLTASYSKDEVLALYLNQTYYGGLAYGVEAAARHYFGKPVRDLDLAECALLAGLPQAPSSYNPLANGDAARARQAEVLAAMVAAGYVTPAEAEAARLEPLQYASGERELKAPHFVFYVIDQLTAELGADQVVRGGLVVTTTLDLGLQREAEDVLRRQLALLASPADGRPDHRARNGAVVVLSPADGGVLALVGSPDFYDEATQGQVNGALALRQPGSAIKPLTYAAALERGWTPASTLLDIPTTIALESGGAYTPRNYDRAYHGPLSLRQALATSSNVAAVRLLDSIGTPALIEMARRLGITSFDEDAGRFGLALTLGGGEVTLLQLSAAFGAFATGGRLVTPATLLAVVDARGRPVALETPGLLAGSAPTPEVLSPQVAFLISDILSDRYARMRAFGGHSVLEVDRPAAVKTGTTSGWRDNWTMGYTPDRVVGVWVGNADGAPMEQISGVTGAGPIWHEVMLAAHHGLPARPFAVPPGIVELPICDEGGALPAPACPATRLERFIAGSEPTEQDGSHQRLRVDAELGCLAPAGYPPERSVERVFRLMPPEAANWAAGQGLPSPPGYVCPLAGQDQVVEVGAPPSGTPMPRLLSPVPGTRFVLSAGLPLERQQIELVALPGDSAGRLTILVDGGPVATLAGPPYKALWQLRPGRHQLQVVAEDGQGGRWQSEVVDILVE
jgi:1A family penicillin-binding protein